MEDNKRIFLKGGDHYLTENGSDAFRVRSGTVLVYIVPVREGEAGRRSFIYEAHAGEVLPGFCHCDPDHQDWRFCLCALEEAVVEVIENGATKVLKKHFAEKADIRAFSVEGYEGGLVDMYRTNLAAEDSFIRRTQNERGQSVSELQSEIDKALRKGDAPPPRTGIPIYDCAAFICFERHIGIAPLDRLREACGKTFGLSDIARLSRFTYRETVLPKKWYKKDLGDLIVFDGNDKPFACLARGRSYAIYDAENEKISRLGKNAAERFGNRAFVIYRPFPARALDRRDILVFCGRSVRWRDIVPLVAVTVLTALICALIPSAAQALYDEYIPAGGAGLFRAGCAAASFMAANIPILIVGALVRLRISARIANDFQNAVYNRLFSLPDRVFGKYDSADLAQRVMSAGSVAGGFSELILTLFISAVYIVTFFVQMASYSAELSAVGAIMALIWAGAAVLVSNTARRYEERADELGAESGSKMYQFLSGISTLRTAGVEDRALLEYMKPYIEKCVVEEKRGRLPKCAALSRTVGGVFAAVFFVVFANGDMGMGAFAGFGAAFGIFAAYLLRAAESVSGLVWLKASAKRLEPLSEAPESSGGKALPGEISGAVEINNVSFSYSADEPKVLDGVSLNIAAGEYVGIVGGSGSGKSTLLKLLLGCETPDSGKIYYDNKDIESVDKRELRRKMGVVMQGGRLISGSILENITITVPEASAEDIEAVIKAAGLDEELKKMPMGLRTVLTEDGRTVSGGQRQRILIARALLARPKILFLDEATSVLDNAAQKTVCEALENMSATRVVIAHRLSTVMRCGRIIVMDGGKIAEQGTYDELMQKDGLFAALAKEQII